MLAALLLQIRQTYAQKLEQKEQGLCCLGSRLFSFLSDCAPYVGQLPWD